MPTQADELRASIVELEAHLPDAEPETRALLEQQIATLHDSIAMLAEVETALEARKRSRPQIPEAMRALFTPQPAADVPTWIPDTATRGEIGEGHMRCPDGAKVYFSETSVGCAVPAGAGRIPARTGLELHFHSTGRLSAQNFYDHGLLRWAITYHATGGRSHVGYYCATERLTYPQHGLHTSYAPNGTVSVQEQCDMGRKHGWTIHWDDDGYPTFATRYEYDVAIESFTPDGTRRAG